MNPIADLISQIKNAGMVKKETVSVPYSKIKHAICEVLANKGFIAGCEKKGKTKTQLIVTLAFDEKGDSVINQIRQISKYSRRVYTKAEDIRPTKSGYGMRVLTTPQGVMSDGEAREKNIGGEVLLEIW